MPQSWSIPRAVVIPTHNRHQMLTQLITSIQHDVNLIVIVDNASTPPYEYIVINDDLIISIIYDQEQPPNLSRLWNVGLDHVAAYMMSRNIDVYDVAILNDDTVLPAGWFSDVSHQLRAHPTAAAASRASYASVYRIIYKTEPDRDLFSRMCPWAFITRGELGIRADESLRWWWGDTDFDWTCRAHGGILIVPGDVALNTAANSTTHGMLAEQAGQDGETFANKWGMRPW